MPCYQINLVSVEFQAKYLNILEAAAKSLGWSYQVYKSGRIALGADMTFDPKRETVEVNAAYQNDVNRLKRAYSREAVTYAAKKKKWFLKKKAQNKNKLQLVRY